LLCANMTGGSLSVIDTKTLRELARVDLHGVNVRGIAIHPDGRSAFVTLQPPLNFQPTSYPVDVWHNFVREVQLLGAESRVAEEQWMDFGAIGCPEQEGIAISPDGRYAFVAVGGRHTVAQITLRDPQRNTAWPFFFRECAVGPNPRALALSPGGKRLWVAHRLGDSVSVLDPAPLAPPRSVHLRPPASPALRPLPF